RNALEFLLRDRVGQDDGIVLILPRQGKSLGMKGSHYLAGEAVDAHDFSHRVFDAKKLLANRFPNHANVRRSIHIILREYGALIDVPALYVEVFWGNAAVGRVPILIAIDDLYWIVHIR